ncbi:predicted protein [Postia placenta Mad-698-R]|uniref:Uncharacterized protein n=1 Tax=Postia placenta MAD-698-R-SB12 TaxID=670580 RepID=A0A1X6MM99_9APHY|nr:hypothetical protein POSPLADRAFT_1050122 [Postia placenta MAD-698-R-SB12]EED78995.1 predicted protein [Postia placenta Mad-698-R]OSX57490.1 hypothetical protein POSPLADRAFT_1050122 [Postia placenta MAD-698-R-SB12]
MTTPPSTQCDSPRTPRQPRATVSWPESQLGSPTPRASSKTEAASDSSQRPPPIPFSLPDVTHQPAKLTRRDFDYERPFTGRTIMDYLCMIGPASPKVYVEGALESTKKLNITEKALAEQQQLKYIVFVNELVTQLDTCSMKMLQDMPQDKTSDENTFNFSRINPYVKCQELSKEIWSEKDSANWGIRRFLEPALACVRCILAKKAGVAWATFDQEFPYPYLSSAPDGPVIPDRILIEDKFIVTETKPAKRTRVSEGKSTVTSRKNKPRVVLTIEVKTVAALHEIVDGDDDGHVLSQLQDMNTNIKPPRGLATRFIWPADKTEVDTQTGLLCQIWTQMLEYESCKLAVLATEDYVIFFARGEDANTMYMSPTYYAKDFPSFRAFSWMSAALGMDQFNNIELPAPLTEWADGRLSNYDGKSHGIYEPTQHSDPILRGGAQRTIKSFIPVII